MRNSNMQCMWIINALNPSSIYYMAEFHVKHLLLFFSHTRWWWLCIYQSYPEWLLRTVGFFSHTYQITHNKTTNRWITIVDTWKTWKLTNYTRISLNFPVLSAHMKNSVTMCVVLKQLDPCIWMVTSCLLVLCAT